MLEPMFDNIVILDIRKVYVITGKSLLKWCCKTSLNLEKFERKKMCFKEKRYCQEVRKEICFKDSHEAWRRPSKCECLSNGDGDT